MRNMKIFADVIKKEKPDVCCLLEINTGALNRMCVNQMKELVSEVNKDVSYPFSETRVKYSHNSILRKLPLFSSNSSGILARKSFEVKIHSFEKSAKGLVYEIILKDKLTLFFAHFSLWNWIRRIQYQELLKIILKRKTEGFDVILCGDFNLFGGQEDSEKFLQDSELILVNKASDKTFPACGPKRVIDLFLVSKEVNVKNIHAVKKVFSDHLPVVLDIL